MPTRTPSTQSSSTSSSPPSGGFDTFGLDPRILRGVESAGFTTPRPIQESTISAAMEGRDILGLAATGTGKTAAFALPILDQLLETPGQGPHALIVAPTRELALQITEEIRLLAKHTEIRVATVFGGVGMAPQIAKLKSRPDIIVACPGRLLDLHRQRVADLSRIEILVLDEADHMFDMGFLPDVRRILAALPHDRQNLLFSATMPPEIRGLADAILDRPHVVELQHSAPASTIEHALYPVDEKQKIKLLERIFDERGFVSSIVFTRTKHRAKRLAQRLEKSGHRAVALQGNMSQGQRERAMDGFRRKSFDILVATDIAARGIDVDQVSHVVNYDMPNTPDAYTHRIGRTGRSEREGKAYTFVTADDATMVRQVERRIGEPIPRRAMDGIAPLPFPSSDRSVGRGRESRQADGRRNENRRRDTGRSNARRNDTDRGDARGTRGSQSRRSQRDDRDRGASSGSQSNARRPGRAFSDTSGTEPTGEGRRRRRRGGRDTNRSGSASAESTSGSKPRSQRSRSGAPKSGAASSGGSRSGGSKAQAERSGAPRGASRDASGAGNGPTRRRRRRRRSRRGGGDAS